MTILTRHKLFDSTEAGVGAWYALDYRVDPGGVLRSIVGNITNGDSLVLEVTNEPTFANGVEITPEVICSHASFDSTDFSYIIPAHFSAVRIRKVGSNGRAVVWGIL